MKIGFIGLGIMGSRMAANLQSRGHALVVYNRTREKAKPLLAQGAVWADSPAALAPQVEVLFTIVAHAAKELYGMAVRAGRGSEDFSAICDYLARNHDPTPGEKAATQPH